MTAERSVTELLVRWGQGDIAARDELMPHVYASLRHVAKRHLARERRGHTLQATALVHEAYVRLIDQHDARWQNRAHFLAIAASLMRRILVDHARGLAARKRGGDAVAVTLPEDVPDARGALDVVELSSALAALAAIDPLQAQIVELRYFGGLTVEETAEAVGISPATVKREWTMARAWLRRELAPRPDGSDPG